MAGGRVDAAGGGGGGRGGGGQGEGGRSGWECGERGEDLSGAEQWRGGRLTPAVDEERFVSLNYENSIMVADEETMRAGPIVLKKAASIKGRIVDETGKPGAGIKVCAQSIHPTMSGSVEVSDGEGFYHLKQLSAGEYNLEVIGKFPEVAKWTAPAQQIKLSAGEQRSGVDIKLIAGGMIRG